MCGAKAVSVRAKACWKSVALVVGVRGSRHTMTTRRRAERNPSWETKAEETTADKLPRTHPSSLKQHPDLYDSMKGAPELKLVPKPKRSILRSLLMFGIGAALGFSGYMLYFWLKESTKQ